MGFFYEERDCVEQNTEYSDSEWNQRRYHNEKVYWNLEFFTKITLVICGGFVYLAINRCNGDPVLIGKLLLLGGLFQLVLGSLCSLNIVSHYRAKWTRRKHKPVLMSRLFIASDFYIIIGILLVSFWVSNVAFGNYLLDGADCESKKAHHLCSFCDSKVNKD